jgi:pseudouridine-5'-monophosphatase
VVLEALSLETRVSVPEFIRRCKEREHDLMPHVEALPGAKELSAQFHQLGVPMAIATSSSAEAVALKRRKHEDVFSRMHAITCGDDAELKQGKPAPDIFLLTARRLGVEPAHCLVFEDSPSGVQAGKAAGMRVVAVPDASMDRRHYAMADKVIDSLRDFRMQDEGPFSPRKSPS